MTKIVHEDTPAATPVTPNAAGRAMSDPITRAEELAIKAGAIVEMIRAASMGVETTAEHISDAAWAAQGMICEVVIALGEYPMERRLS